MMSNNLGNKQLHCIYLQSNISRSKGNQTMKFGQLTEYDMTNIFLEKLYTKCLQNHRQNYSQTLF